MPRPNFDHRAPLVALALLASPLDAAVLRPLARPPQEDGGLVMRWSVTERVSPDLERWHRRNAAALASVEQAWKRLLDRLAGQIPTRFSERCEALAERLDSLDEVTLLPAPDRLLDLYLKRMLWHLHQVGGRCRPDQLWNVVYHLEEARHALAEVRWVLERHGVENRERHTSKPSTDSPGGGPSSEKAHVKSGSSEDEDPGP